MPTNTPAVQNPDDAFGLIQERVYAPAFFAKLASDYNIQPQDLQQARQLLALADELREIHNHTTKQASEGFLSEALANLQAHTQQLGLRPKAAQVAQRADAQVTQLANQIALDPVLAHAALSLQAATVAP